MSASHRGVVDLDAARKARAETVGEGPLVVLEGQEYELAAELPMDAILVVTEELGNIGDGDHKPDPKIVLSALEGLFGEHWETLRPKLSVQDCMYVLTELLELYGTDLPEPSASASS